MFPDFKGVLMLKHKILMWPNLRRLLNFSLDKVKTKNLKLSE